MPNPTGLCGPFPTDRQYTGQRWEAALGIYDYRARFYSPKSGRFLSVDTIVPGAADSAGGGAATLGYSEQTRLTPLTVGFHETQFLGILNTENRELLQYGPPALWDGKVRQEHTVPMGPANPQALNRYAYCLGNPLRYVDPTGHDTLVWEFTTADLGYYSILLANASMAYKEARAGWAIVGATAAFFTLAPHTTLIAGTVAATCGLGVAYFEWEAMQIDAVIGYFDEAVASAGEGQTITVQVYEKAGGLLVVVKGAKDDLGVWITGDAANTFVKVFERPENYSLFPNQSRGQISWNIRRKIAHDEWEFPSVNYPLP